MPRGCRIFPVAQRNQRKVSREGAGGLDSAFDWAPRVAALTRNLVRIPSVVGTPGEGGIARWLYQQLADLPYFAAHPGQLRLHPAGRDRYSVVALVKGGRASLPARTLILMGHIDIVPFDDYGPLAPIACDPDALAARPGAPIGYMEGRGSVDMKSGVAANLAVLERYAAEAEGMEGALLFP
jgi:arginine utilization protein RocB